MTSSNGLKSAVSKKRMQAIAQPLTVSTRKPLQQKKVNEFHDSKGNIAMMAGWYYREIDVLSALQYLKSLHKEIGDSVYEDFNGCGQEHLVTDVLNVCRDLWWKKINEAFPDIYNGKEVRHSS